MWTDDPVHDAAMRDLEMEREAEEYPVCDICGEPIYPGDWYTVINEEHYHENCIHFKEYYG